MPSAIRRTVLVLLCAALLIVPATTMAASPADTGIPPTVNPHTILELTPDTAGQVTGKIAYRLPSTVTEFTIHEQDFDRVTLRATDNLRATHDGYEWTGNGTPTLTYTKRLPTDRLASSGDGIDAGEWAVVRPPSYRVRWQFTGEAPQYRKSTETDGDGIAGNRLVLLGDHTATTGTVAGQELTIAVPASRELQVDPEALFETYRFANDHLTLQQSSEPGLGIAVPDARGSKDAGRAHGTDFYVQNRRTLDEPSSIWIHEYIHTGEQAELAPDMGWFNEATANYYTTTITFNQGKTEFDLYLKMLAGDRFDRAVLTDQSTWREHIVQYAKGEHVIAALDAQVQDETDGEKTMREVYAAVQQSDGAVTYHDFRAILRTVAGDETVAWADDYIDGPGTPPLADDPSVYLFDDVDTDGDGLTNAEEETHRTDPLSADTGGGGILDGRAVERGISTEETDAETTVSRLEKPNRTGQSVTTRGVRLLP